MRVCLLTVSIVLLGYTLVKAQVPGGVPGVKAFIARFQQAVETLSQPITGAVPAVQYFLTDSSKVADTSYPDVKYESLFPTAPAKTWLSKLSTAFGNVLFYTIDTTHMTVRTGQQQNGQPLIMLTMPVVIEGLRASNQTRHQLSEEQVWQLVGVPKATDKLALGYRIVSIESMHKLLHSASLTADRFKKLQHQLKDMVVKLAWEGTDEKQRKAVLDRWRQAHYPDTVYVTQGDQVKKIGLIDWGKQRMKADTLATLTVESVDIRWADLPFKTAQQETLRRITDWAAMRLVSNDSLLFKARNVFYEKTKPSAKNLTEPTLTVVHIHLRR